MEKVTNWEEINKSWQESGLPQQAYCEKNGIDYACFCSWRSRQIQQGKLNSLRYKKSEAAIKAQEKLDFIPLSLKRSQPKEKSHGFIEICLPHGIVMRIPANGIS